MQSGVLLTVWVWRIQHRKIKHMVERFIFIPVSDNIKLRRIMSVRESIDFQFTVIVRRIVEHMLPINVIVDIVSGTNTIVGSAFRMSVRFDVG